MTLWQKIETAAVLALLGSCGAFGCSKPPAQVPSPSRALCYANAQQHAQARVNAECTQDAGPCPARDAILAEFKAAQEACPQ